MPASKSFLEGFSGLDQLTAPKLMEERGGIKNLDLLENELGNRLLYTEALPLSAQELEFDLSILKQALRLQSPGLYNFQSQKITIPEALLDHFPSISQLALTFIEAYGPQGIVSIYLQSERLGIKPLGTLIKPENVALGGEIMVKVDGKDYKLKAGQLQLIPALSNKVDFVFFSPGIKLAGKNQLSAEVVGGSLGIVVDLRTI